MLREGGLLTSRAQLPLGAKDRNLEVSRSQSPRPAGLDRYLSLVPGKGISYHVISMTYLGLAGIWRDWGTLAESASPARSSIQAAAAAASAGEGYDRVSPPRSPGGRGWASRAAPGSVRRGAGPTPRSGATSGS